MPDESEKTVKNEDKTTAMVAAIGAGMVPATMALLMPLFLGRRRRRRNVDTVVKPHLDLQQSKHSMNQPIYRLFM